MKRTLQLLVLPLGLAFAAAVPSAAQDFGVRAHIGVGNVDIGVRAGDVRPHWRYPRYGYKRPYQKVNPKRQPLLFGSGPVNDFARDQKRAAQNAPVPRHRPYRPRRHRPLYLDAPFAPLYLYGGGYYEDPFYDDAYVEEPVREPEPMPAVEAPPPQPPDARGPRFELARGVGLSATADYEVGQPLPRGVPHVALDWEEYGFPRPPAGQSYVRFGQDVLLIVTDTRVVTRVLWPTEG